MSYASFKVYGSAEFEIEIDSSSGGQEAEVFEKFESLKEQVFAILVEKFKDSDSQISETDQESILYMIQELGISGADIAIED